jgi:hypothetical protein
VARLRQRYRLANVAEFRVVGDLGVRGARNHIAVVPLHDFSEIAVAAGGPSARLKPDSWG